MNCENCVYYDFDEEDELYTCTVDMDEDDYSRLISSSRSFCPYFKNGDEYAVVKRQM